MISLDFLKIQFVKFGFVKFKSSLGGLPNIITFGSIVRLIRAALKGVSLVLNNDIITVVLSLKPGETVILSYFLSLNEAKL